MYKAVSIWTAPKPEDLEAFEEYYWAVHVPFAAKIPRATRLVLTRTADGMDAPPAFYRVAELIFDNEDDFRQAVQSPQWAAVRADAERVIERFGVSLSSALGTQVDAVMDNR
jgi:uncharacterized protein (TIGR02118 family)